MDARLAPALTVHGDVADDQQLVLKFRQATVGIQGAHNDNIIMKHNRGNTRAYAIARLRKDRPDIHARVRAGEGQQRHAGRQGQRKWSSFEWDKNNPLE